MAAQSNIEINIVNLSSIALTITNVSVSATATWATAPNEGDTISASGTSGATYVLSNNNSLNTTGNIILTGNYNNQWQISFAWLQTGTPQATLQSLSSNYSGIRVAGYTSGGGLMQLTNVQPATDTASYSLVFNKG